MESTVKSWSPTLGEPQGLRQEGQHAVLSQSGVKREPLPRRCSCQGVQILSDVRRGLHGGWLGGMRGVTGPPYL